MFIFGLEIVLFSQKYHRWRYQGGNPNALARLINRVWTAVHSLLRIAPGVRPPIQVDKKAPIEEFESSPRKSPSSAWSPNERYGE